MSERWRRADPFVVDGLLALFCAVVTIATVVAVEPNDGPDLDAVGVVLLLGQTLPVAWRRRRPVLAWAVCGLAATIWGVAEFPDTVLDLGPLIVVFSVAAHCRRRTATVLGVATAAVIGLALLAAGDASAADVSFNFLVFGVAWALGENQRTRRAYTAELEEKAARLERSQAEQAERAAAQERSRIARELHDVVAHHVSMMVVQAEGGASVLEASPEQAAQAFDAIGAAGRQAMAEMRRVLGVLRDGGDGAAGRSPQPGLEAVVELVEGVRRAGLPVELRVEGRPRPLPAGLDLSAYRIVQEALTNALRHARAGQATVTVLYAEEHLELEVADDGQGPPADLAGGTPANGHGLVGMRERVALFGGELSVGDREGGGFAVVAHLPTRP
ncbi:MAG TPA: sensor histidine kinase [Acidimicrobiales bacterium]|nr:sensor histidine kinase [Acidimicrobiales bacterium]